jgi:hypothetical protein
MKIRKDLVAEDLAVSIQFIDDKVDYQLDHSATLEIEEKFTSSSKLNDEGMNMIITINDPCRWWLVNREAFSYSIDFQS